MWIAGNWRGEKTESKNCDALLVSYTRSFSIIDDGSPSNMILEQISNKNIVRWESENAGPVFSATSQGA